MKGEAEGQAKQSKCPVKHNIGNDSGGADSTASFWNRFWHSDDNVSTDEQKSPGCRSDMLDSSASSSSVPPVASLEEAARHAQTPQPDQTVRLATHRQVSGIPRGGSAGDSNMESLPHHQQGYENDKSKKWVYPSEQQLYNAMRRKGWSNIPEESIPVVLQIHNGINERTWQQIQDWEGGNQDLQLARFQGRPRDITPKAFFYSRILGLYDPPFDRHDWYVKGDDNSREQRYVIDYYYLPPSDPNLPPIPYVDARPALDHPRVVWLQSRRFFQNAFPGITMYYKRLFQ